MSKLYGFSFPLLLMFISSCNPKITRNITNAYPALDNMQEVIVFDMEHTAPQEAEYIGRS